MVPTGAAGNLAGFSKKNKINRPLNLDCIVVFFFGQILAGFLAREMGFPIKLVATVNSNDILARTFENGDYSPAPDVATSLAPAMDIQVISP